MRAHIFLPSVGKGSAFTMHPMADRRFTFHCLTQKHWLLLAINGLLWALARPALAAPITAQAIEAWVQDAAQRELSYLGNTRIQVQVGKLGPTMNAAPCANPEVQTARGTRLWGRSTVALRCPNQTAWSLRVPINVRVWGDALVATRPLSASTTIEASDLRSSIVELTQEPQGMVTELSQLAGQVPTRMIRTGQPIPLVALRIPPAVNQGDPVKVIGRGKGFSVATEGVALGTALEGQNVRVRTPSGRILTGIAKSGRLVEVKL